MSLQIISHSYSQYKFQINRSMMNRFQTETGVSLLFSFFLLSSCAFVSSSVTIRSCLNHFPSLILYCYWNLICCLKMDHNKKKNKKNYWQPEPKWVSGKIILFGSPLDTYTFFLFDFSFFFFRLDLDFLWDDFDDSFNCCFLSTNSFWRSSVNGVRYWVSESLLVLLTSNNISLFGST